MGLIHYRKALIFNLNTQVDKDNALRHLKMALTGEHT